MLLPIPARHHGRTFPGLYSDLMTSAQRVQVAKSKKDIELEILTLSQLHVINVGRLRDLDNLAVRLNTTSIRSIRQEECECIIAEKAMVQKMGTPTQYGGFPLATTEFKTWLHMKMLTDAETPLIDRSRPPPVDCIGCYIDVSIYPIRRPHPCDLRIVCRLIERSLLPDIDKVIDIHAHMFEKHNFAYSFCKGHINDLSACLLYHHLKLASLKEDENGLILG